MKFTSLAVAALFLANTSAVKLNDDCGGKWCNKGLSYDYDEATLNKAKADNVVKTDYYNAAAKALEIAQGAQAASQAAATAAGNADAAAGAAKSAASAQFAATDYKDSSFPSMEKANYAAVKAKEVALDNKFKADDDLVAKTLIMNRKQRDFDAASAAKAASDANLKANEERFAYESDQLERGQNQDRLKFVNQDTAADTSAIKGRHDERTRHNVSLLKALASFRAIR